MVSGIMALTQFATKPSLEIYRLLGLNFSGNFGSGGFGAWLQSLSTEDRARAQAIADRYIHMGYANGGLVSGPGSGTSDSIRAKLSNGEYVVPAARVPANFNALERMRIGKSPDNDNSSLINEVRSLRDEVRSLKSVTYEGSRNISEKVGEGNDIAKRQSGITKGWHQTNDIFSRI